MSGRQRDNSIPLGEQELASTPKQRASPALDECCKGSFDFAIAADVENFDLLPNGRSRSSDLSLGSGEFGIDEHGNSRGSWPQFTQEPKLLRRKLHRHEADTGDVATKPVEAGDEANLDRVAPRANRLRINTLALGARIRRASYRPVSIGRILTGAKPAEVPVMRLPTGVGG
jgi:hypothetical protein